MSENGSEKKEKQKKALELDLTNSTRDVWLVKVPKYISDRWSKAGPNADVGKLRITRGVGSVPQVSLTLADSVCAPIQGISEQESLNLVRNSSTSQEIPKEHKFKISGVASQTLGVFSVTPGDKEHVPPIQDKVEMEGRVVQRGECAPINSKNYMSIKKEAITKAGEPVRKVMQLTQHVQGYKPVARHAMDIEHEREKKKQGKKMRDDKDKVQEVLFSLFEKHQFYNIKDLAQETRQPINYLKEILNEVCMYNVKPPNRNMWELKPEFRHYKEEKTETKKNDSDSDSD